MPALPWRCSLCTSPPGNHPPLPTRRRVLPRVRRSDGRARHSFTGACPARILRLPQVWPPRTRFPARTSPKAPTFGASPATPSTSSRSAASTGTASLTAPADSKEYLKLHLAHLEHEVFVSGWIIVTASSASKNSFAGPSTGPAFIRVKS